MGLTAIDGKGLPNNKDIPRIAILLEMPTNNSMLNDSRGSLGIPRWSQLHFSSTIANIKPLTTMLPK